MKKMDLNELNRLYLDAEGVDKELFAEMRSNVLLISGDHYTKNVNQHFARLRETNRLTETMKLRLTKNHIHRAQREYVEAIISKAPGVKIIPNNDSEMQDQKDSQLNQAVWDHIKRKHKFSEKVRDFAEEFVGIGEVATKVFWDPGKGDIIGYEQATDESGEPVFEERQVNAGPDPISGEPVIQIEQIPIQDKAKPIYSGDFVFEPLYGFNILRPAGAKRMQDAEWLTVRKMIPQDELKYVYKEDPEKMKMLEKSSDTDFIVFESSKSKYEKTEKHILLKETYFKPCGQYPHGYFYIYTEFGILEEGELPYGIFPIRWKGFDNYPTTPRGRSIIKVARPYQAEINRAASQEATHQITLGDDKVLYQSGTKLAPGALLPGVRGISFQGTPPTILPGRNGQQYAGYTEGQINDMERAIMLESTKQNEATNLDPYSLLFSSAKQQAKYKKYVEKFSEFIVDVVELTLELAKHYLPDEMLIKMIGRNEGVNIKEFRKTESLAYQITVEPMSDSIDSMLGKQLTFNHMLQYVGKQLKPEEIGKIMRNMPYMNNEESFGDLTIEYDNVKNDMLAMERGEIPEVSPYADSVYYIKKLTHRMKQADFRFLRPEIQQNYQGFLQAHQQEEVRKQEAIIAAKNEYIPAGGALISTSMLVPDEGSADGSPKKARVPYQALEWLLKQLEKQGMSLDKLEEMNQGALAEMAQQMTSQKNQQPINPGMGRVM